MSRWKAYLTPPEVVLLADLEADMRFAKVRRIQLIRRATRRMERAAQRAQKELTDDRD